MCGCGSKCQKLPRQINIQQENSDYRIVQSCTRMDACLTAWRFSVGRGRMLSPFHVPEQGLVSL